MRFVLAALVFAAIAATVVVVTGEQNRYIHPPSKAPTGLPGTYDPEEIIRMTLHEYKTEKRREYNGQHAEHETTGRYVTFGIPRKFVMQHALFRDQVPFRMLLQMDWKPNAEGVYEFASRFNDEGLAPKPRARAQELVSYTTPFDLPSHARYSDKLVTARKQDPVFEGYRNSTAWFAGAKQIWYLGEACGLDAFEYDSARRDFTPQSLAALKQDPRRFGRVFGYPAGAEQYEVVISCRELPNSDMGHCLSSEWFNEYLTTNYSFSQAMICEAPDAIRQHKALLRSLVIDEGSVREN